MDRDQRHETLPERLIREAIEVGEFDDLPGQGQPLPGAGQPDDDLWWVRAWVRRSAPETPRRRVSEGAGGLADASDHNATDGTGDHHLRRDLSRSEDT